MAMVLLYLLLTNKEEPTGNEIIQSGGPDCSNRDTQESI